MMPMPQGTFGSLTFSSCRRTGLPQDWMEILSTQDCHTRGKGQASDSLQTMDQTPALSLTSFRKPTLILLLTHFSVSYFYGKRDGQ